MDTLGLLKNWGKEMKIGSRTCCISKRIGRRGIVIWQTP